LAESLFGAPREHMLPTGIRRVEPVSAQIQLADLGMAHVGYSRAVTHLARHQFAETWSGRGQFSD